MCTNPLFIKKTWAPYVSIFYIWLYIYMYLWVIQYPTISNLNFLTSWMPRGYIIYPSTNQPFMKSVSKLDTQLWWNINHSHLMVLSYQYCSFFLGVQFHHTTLQPGSTWTHHNAADNGFGLGCTYAPLSWPFPSFTTVQPVLHIELKWIELHYFLLKYPSLTLKSPFLWVDEWINWHVTTLSFIQPPFSYFIWMQLCCPIW